jgi:hypothetical protein
VATFVGEGRIAINGREEVIEPQELDRWDIQPSPALGLVLDFRFHPRPDHIHTVKGLVQDAGDGIFQVRVQLAFSVHGPTANHNGESWVIPRAELAEIALTGMHVEREPMQGEIVHLLAHRTDYGTYVAYWSLRPPTAVLFGEVVKRDGMTEQYDTVRQAIAAARQEAARRLTR